MHEQQRQKLEKECRECQKQFAEARDRAGQFSIAHPVCRCDQVSISEHSPGRIRDNEKLVRFVLDPKHIDPKDGTIDAAHFDEMFSYGLSLSRLKYQSRRELLKHAQNVTNGAQQRENDKAKKENKEPQKFSCKVVYFNAARVRQHQIEDGKSFCIMDSAEINNHAHADITFSGGSVKGSERIKIRNELRKTLANPKPHYIKYYIWRIFDKINHLKLYHSIAHILKFFGGRK